jgi:YcxB-like protein
MSDPAYSFELGVDDYVAMNMHRWRSLGSWYRNTAKSAWAVVLVVFAFLAFGHMQVDLALVAALGVAAVYLLISPWFWRRRYVRCLRQHYGRPPADRLMGAHTLTIGPEGIESTGPYHRTSRAWPAVTEAFITSRYVLIHTIFGNVYILPRRAVSNPEEVRRLLEAHLPTGAVRDA